MIVVVVGVVVAGLFAWKKVGSTAVLQQVSCNLDLGRD